MALFTINYISKIFLSYVKKNATEASCYNLFFLQNFLNNNIIYLFPLLVYYPKQNPVPTIRNLRLLLTFSGTVGVVSNSRTALDRKEGRV